jgi:hypothetical protein
MATQGDNRNPKTEPRLTRAIIIRELCNHNLGMNSHVKPVAMEIREAGMTGKERPRTMNTPHENKKANITLKIILNLEMGTIKRIRLSRATAPKK